jgi:hypothetical protein
LPEQRDENVCAWLALRLFVPPRTTLAAVIGGAYYASIASVATV